MLPETIIMTTVRIHLTGLLLLLSYAALINSMSVQKPTVNSSKLTLKPNSSTMPEVPLNKANDMGGSYPRGAGSSGRENGTLNVHNRLRRDVDPPAANMPKLRWSSDLTHLAELWSRHCIMGYGLPLTLDPLPYSGQILQNIWLGGRNDTIEDALSSWLSEGNDYNFKTMTCYRANGCKNYITMVSASVHEVGCGLSHCNDDVKVTCYYGARDYRLHQSPYAAGKPCSQCAAFEWCDSGLCRSSGNNGKDKSVGTNCVYREIDRESNDGTAVSLADGSRLKRQRRHTTENAQGTCDAFTLPFWIFLGILIGVVLIGLLIGIIYMLAHICKDTCTGCRDTGTSDGCCLGCCATARESSRCCTGSNSSGMSETSGGSPSCAELVCRLRCCKRRRVKPHSVGTTESDPTRSAEEPGGSDSPDANVPGPDPSLVHAEIHVEYREICTNTDPEPLTIDRSTCTEHDLLETNDAGTSVDLELIDAAVQVDIEPKKEEPGEEPKKDEPKKEEPEEGEEKEEEEEEEKERNTDGDGHEEENQSDKNSDRSSYHSHTDIEQIDPADSSHGVCLVHNCQTCDLHKRDRRQVDKLRTNNIRKLIKASKSQNLAPGTYII